MLDAVIESKLHPGAYVGSRMATDIKLQSKERVEVGHLAKIVSEPAMDEDISLILA